MISAIHRRTGQFIRNVRSPGLTSRDWLVNPDLSGVEGVPQRYWKVDGNRVVAMSRAERAAVDAGDGAALRQALRARLADPVVAVLIEEMNALRIASGLPARSATDIEAAAAEKAAQQRTDRNETA